MNNDYGFLDTNHGSTPYVLPPIPCGWYEHTSPYGEKTVFQFRRMPRAGKYTGKYGLWLDHPDAHMVLIGVVEGGVLREERSVYSKDYYPLFLDTGRVKLTQRTCAWCGRKLTLQEEFTHDSSKCQPASTP